MTHECRAGVTSRPQRRHVELRVRSMSMSNPPERPPGNQGPSPYAPRWARDPAQAKIRPVTPTKDSALAREEADEAAYERAFSLGDSRLAPSVPPPPPTSPRKAFVTVRELMLLALVAMISAFAVMIIYPRTPGPDPGKPAAVAGPTTSRQSVAASSDVVAAIP